MPRCERGQASVELVAIVPFVLLVGAVVWQLALAGHAAWAGANAARVAARAEAVGRDGERAARSALPSYLERGLTVDRERRARYGSACASRSSLDSRDGWRSSRPRLSGGRRGERAGGERGQASVELLGALPAVLLVGLALLQLLAVGYTKVEAGERGGGGGARAGGRGRSAGCGAGVPAGLVARTRADLARRWHGAGHASSSVAAARARRRFEVEARPRWRTRGEPGRGSAREGRGTGCSSPRTKCAEREQPMVQRRVVVAVFGLGPGCGATTVARGLGAELAARDACGACVVTAAS